MNKKTVKQGLDAIAKHDRDVSVALQQIGYPQPRKRPMGFEALLIIIVNQQISVEAASSILNRIRERFPDLSPEALLASNEGCLREAGMSARKEQYARCLAVAIVEGSFDPAGLKKLDDEAAIQEIVTLRGFGRWSAEIYLMFSLRRKDVFPADDLALQLALQRLKNLPTKPSGKQARELTASWSPWRTMGSLFLWHYYRGAPS
ncbi:MAG: DNA-3-methyladenine glycosylase family protein [Pseudomonadales bacterium]